MISGNIVDKFPCAGRRSLSAQTAITSGLFPGLDFVGEGGRICVGSYNTVFYKGEIGNLWDGTSMCMFEPFSCGSQLSRIRKP